MRLLNYAYGHVPEIRAANMGNDGGFSIEEIKNVKNYIFNHKNALEGLKNELKSIKEYLSEDEPMTFFLEELDTVHKTYGGKRGTGLQEIKMCLKGEPMHWTGSLLSAYSYLASYKKEKEEIDEIKTSMELKATLSEDSMVPVNEFIAELIGNINFYLGRYENFESLVDKIDRTEHTQVQIGSGIKEIIGLCNERTNIVKNSFWSVKNIKRRYKILHTDSLEVIKCKLESIPSALNNAKRTYEEEHKTIDDEEKRKAMFEAGMAIALSERRWGF